MSTKATVGAVGSKGGGDVYSGVWTEGEERGVDAVGWKWNRLGKREWNAGQWC
jgi:hypothetical protein